jgi:hypothetical protein
MVVQHVIRVGSRVRVCDGERAAQFTIVPECEADAFADRISAERHRSQLGGNRQREGPVQRGDLVGQSRACTRVVSDELEEVVLAVLQFVDSHRPDIERARLRDTERPLANIEDHPLAASDAILAETAMLLYLASRCPVSVATRRTLDGVAAWLSPLARSPN